MRKCSKCGEFYEGAEMFCPADGARLLSTTEEGLLKTNPPPEVIKPDNPEDALIGTVIQGRYKVLSKLGEGGMGVVYVAEHVEIEKKVALKVLRDDFSKRPEVVERFRQEAKAASKIGHEHIVDVTDFGQLNDGGVYFVMEYLRGESLDEGIDGKPVPLERAVPIVHQIARALDAAHKLGIVHRDLKPENIFLVRREEHQDFVKVLDFGIAKISDRDSEGKRLTKTGMIFGTPEYMSPEQAAGKPLDHRVDIYALGCIMFEMFTGDVPYNGESFMAVLTQHMFEPVPAIEEIIPETDVPESVRAVVYKAMAKQTSDRYSDMSALEEDLGRALRDSSFNVEYPGNALADRLSYSGRGGRSDLSQRFTIPRKGETKMDVAPGSGAYPAQEKKSRRWVVLSTIAALLIVSGGTAAYLGGILDSREKDTIGGPLALPVDTETIVEEKKDTGALEGLEKEPVATDIEEKYDSKIEVRINTVPKGAVVTIEGMGQVCSNTPCTVKLDANVPAKIEAMLLDERGKMTFTPSGQNTLVKLELRGKKETDRSPKKVTKTRKTSTSSSAKSKKDIPVKKAGKKETSSGNNDGLRIPDIFKKR